MKPIRLYPGCSEEFTYRGYTFRASLTRDDCMREPWKEHDGHGIISDWTRRGKGPGERVLTKDRGSFRYYDVAETVKTAKRDGWGCSHYGTGTHKTKGEAIACAVDEDFERMRRWCADDWCWVSVRVALLDEDGTETEVEYLGGIESDAGEYLADTARELADEILSRVEVDEPLAVRSNN